LGIRLAILIFSVTLVFVSPASATKMQCLKCHPIHFAELGDCTLCHRGDPRSIRPEIAHHGLVSGAYAQFKLPGSPVTETGKRLLEQFACRRCHVIGKRGNRLASELDQQIARTSPLDLRESILRPVLFMPDFRLPEAHLVAVINALLAVALPLPGDAQEIPMVVHFEIENSAENPFDKHCGACHRVLTAGHGGLGRGDIGPNLSGLFSPFYPKTFKDEQPWTAENLKKWIENPREIRPFSRMQPVRLKDVEYERLRDLLWEKERVVDEGTGE
jgi:cytochrome c2